MPYSPQTFVAISFAIILWLPSFVGLFAGWKVLKSLSDTAKPLTKTVCHSIAILSVEFLSVFCATILTLLRPLENHWGQCLLFPTIAYALGCGIGVISNRLKD
jgi:hypothetical protein